MKKPWLPGIVLALLCSSVTANPRILSMQERAAVIDRWLTARVQTVLPDLMRRSGIDLWVIVSREYNEDPVIRTFLPSKWQSARRRTILLVYDAGEGQPLETLAVARYAVGEMFTQAWDKERDGDQWTHLANLIEEREPQRIGLNFSETFALADGITQTEYRLFHEALPERLHPRVVSAEMLAIGWLETRTPEEMAVYPQIVRVAHEIIAEGLSEAVIQPGITTTKPTPVALRWICAVVHHVSRVESDTCSKGGAGKSDRTVDDAVRSVARHRPGTTTLGLGFRTATIRRPSGRICRAQL